VGQKPAFFVVSPTFCNEPETMQTKLLESKITDLITHDLTVMGYEIVRVHLMSGGLYLTLQVMAERIDSKPMTVDDCIKISHAASAKLDSDETIVNRYTLEVSSPGIDRPLVRLKDFERFAGHVARIELDVPQNGTKRFQGKINRITGHEPDVAIELSTETGDICVPMNGIARARLVLTDALLKAQDSTKH
jgi:ribosome maturation factor RimP